jgi:hypothetical protein
VGGVGEVTGRSCLPALQLWSSCPWGASSAPCAGTSAHPPPAAARAFPARRLPRAGGGGGGGGSPRSTAARRHSCTFCEPGPLGITWQRYQLPGRQRGQEMMLVPIVTGVKAGGASQRAGVQKLQLLHSINGMPVLQQEWCVYPPVGPEKSKSTKESRDCHTARARALCSTSHCLRG